MTLKPLKRSCGGRRKNPGFNDVFIPKGEPLFKEGQVAGYVYLIDDGQIEIYSKTQDKTLAVLGANQIFGEQSILFEGRRSASAIARVDTRCLEVEGGKWRSFLDKQTRPAVLGFKPLMLEQVQNNFVNMGTNLVTTSRHRNQMRSLYPSFSFSIPLIRSASRSSIGSIDTYIRYFLRSPLGPKSSARQPPRQRH